MGKIKRVYQDRICIVCKDSYSRTYERGKQWDKRLTCYNKECFYKNVRLKLTGIKRSSIAVENNRKAQLGKKLSETHKEKLRIAGFKRRDTIETRLKRSRALSGANHYNWQGGITEENHKIRRSVQYRIWRDAVYKRDNYTCVSCGSKKGGTFQADHIKPFAYYPELRFEVSNGRTLCIDCHKKTPTYGRRLVITA